MAQFGTDAQKQQWLPRLCSGEILGAFGLTEPGGGTDAGATRTTARLDGDEWVINGSKSFITNSGTDITGFVVVTAVTGEKANGGKEISAILVPSGDRWAGRRAAVLQGRLELLGHPWARLRRRPGAGGEPGGRTGTRLRAVPGDPRRGAGGHRGAGDRAVAGLRGRVGALRAAAAGVRSADRDNQAVQFLIADMEVRAHTSRLLWRDAASRQVAGQPFKRQASIAKLYSSEAAVDNARYATQVHGGYGFMNEFPVGRFYRDAKILEIGEGTSEVQRMLIARDLGL